MAMPPLQFAERIADGLLSFPVTHFTDRLEFDEAAYRDHLGWQAGFDVAGLFAAGGTGEFFSLLPEEVDRVVRAAIDEVDGRVPVIAPAGQSVVLARSHARAAEAAGADGILLFPPYLIDAPAEGLVAYVEAVCAATGLGVVLYNRANGSIDAESLAILAERCPNLVGVKDGVGDIELMTRIHARFAGRFTLVGGLPTAETFALPYLRLGVSTYSSAIFNFLPEFALDFYRTVRLGDQEDVYRRLNEFVLPYLAIRDRKRGYAVSIVKAGLRAAGRPSSAVRPPLADLLPAEVDELRRLIERTRVAAPAAV